MRFLGNLQMLLLAAVAFSLLASVVVSAAVPWLVRHTAAWAPASRYRALVVLGLATPILAVAALISVLSPSLLAFAWPELDHCTVHEHHAHLCFVHLSHDAGTLLGWVIIAAALLGLGLRLVPGAFSLLSAPGLFRQLVQLAHFDSQRKAWVLPTKQPFCVSIGLLRPRVLVSEGLLATASADELQVMLAHEAAHVRRKHTLARCLVRAGSLLLVPRCRAALLTTLELSAEQVCDEAAAGQVGDRLCVAETIVAMERRLATVTGVQPMVAAFGASCIAQRVEAMLSPPRPAGPRPLLSLLFISLVVGLLAVSSRLHHLTESTLAFLAH